MHVFQMIETVVETGHASECRAKRKGAHVSSESPARTIAANAQHRNRQVDTDRSIAARCEEFHRQTSAARDVEVRIFLGGKAIDDVYEQLQHSAENTPSEGLLLGVSAGAVRLPGELLQRTEAST